MEKRITQLFGYQRFEQNAHLANLIKDTESRYSAGQREELSDDLLTEVNAAGQPIDPMSGCGSGTALNLNDVL